MTPTELGQEITLNSEGHLEHILDAFLDVLFGGKGLGDNGCDGFNSIIKLALIGLKSFKLSSDFSSR